MRAPDPTPVSNLRPSTAGSLPFLWSRSRTAKRRLILLSDVFFSAVLIAFCTFQYRSCARYADFIHEDVSYYELGRALLTTHIYGFNGTTETTQPPGLALLIAFLCRTTGCTPIVLLQLLTVCFMLGLFASYWLLRRRHGCLVAGAACVLTAFSPSMFTYTTRFINPAVPYLLASTLTLLGIAKLNRAKSYPSAILWQLICAILLGASVLVQTSGIALIAAIGVWLVVSCLKTPARAREYLWKFLPVAFAGCVILFAWMHRANHAVKEWSLEGYPGSYLSQVVMKNGQQPELGHAALSDYVVRFGANLEAYMDVFVGLFTSHWVDVTWSAFVPGTIILLVVLSLLDSIFRRGPSICDWYFLSYLSIYLLWPWNAALRFLIPVIPLFCVYVFDGFYILPRFVRERPRLAGAIGVPLFATLATDAAFLGLQHRSGGLQLRLSAGIWILCCIISIVVLWRNSSPMNWLVAFFRSHAGDRLFGLSANRVLTSVGLLLLFAHVALAFQGDLRVAHQNLSPSTEKTDMRFDIDAARWVSVHTDRSAIIMARHVPTVFHYSQRKTIWFAPISTPAILMDGIRRHSVDYVIVVRRQYSYYLPPEAECFALLRSAYPASFTLVEDKTDYQIFRVEPLTPAVEPGASVSRPTRRLRGMRFHLRSWRSTL